MTWRQLDACLEWACKGWGARPVDDGECQVGRSDSKMALNGATGEFSGWEEALQQDIV